MQVAIPHQLGRDEVRRRLQSRSHELAGVIPGGMAEVDTSWPSEDRMNLSVMAMGQAISGHIDIRDTEIEVQLLLPPALGFVQPGGRGRGPPAGPSAAGAARLGPVQLGSG